MKNTIKILGIISLILIIGFSFASCGGSPSDDSGAAPTSVVYESKAPSGDIYILDVTSASVSRAAAYSPAVGDRYTLTIIIKSDSSIKKSAGTVTTVNGATLNLSGGTNLAVTVGKTNGVSTMGKIEGTITTSEGDNVPAPGNVKATVVVPPTNINLIANKWEKPGDIGENWMHGWYFFETAQKYNLPIIPTEVTPIKGKKFIFRLSGTTYKTLKEVYLVYDAFFDDWQGYQWLGGTTTVGLSGTFNQTFEIDITDNPKTDKTDLIIRLSLYNNDKVPANAENLKTVLATIKNCELRLIDIKEE